MKITFRVKTIEQLSGSEEVKFALKRLAKVSKPSVDFGKLVSCMGILYKVDDKKLEYYLSKYSAWQSYYAEQMIIAEVVKVVAESQANVIYSYCVDKSIGTINTKKELARSEPLYVIAVNVFNAAKSSLKVLTINFENAERGYRVSSRIMGRRIGIKEFD